MLKRQAHYYRKLLQPISGWYFLIAAVVFLSLAAFALRQNNLRMLELRQEVFQADEAGDDVETPLRELREFVHGHMNTNLVSSETAIRPPIQLKYSYERTVAQKQQQFREENEAVYERAEEICEARFPAGQLASGRVQCIESYVTENATAPPHVPKELYQFDFASPRWSPDLAGWSLLLGGLSMGLFMIRFGVEYWLKRQAT